MLQLLPSLVISKQKMKLLKRTVNYLSAVEGDVTNHLTSHDLVLLLLTKNYSMCLTSVTHEAMRTHFYIPNSTTIQEVLLLI
jgi:hypothetical protein